MRPCETRAVSDPHELIRATWRQLTGCSRGFTTDGVVVSVADHDVAPRGWVGTVSLGGAAVLAIRPDDTRSIDRLTGLSVTMADIREPESATAMFGPLADTLGPAVLSYLIDKSASSADLSMTWQPLPPTDDRVLSIIEACDPAEVEESAIDSRRSGIFVAADPTGNPMAACGYSPVLGTLAHVGVLTRTDARGKGYGLQAASAAIDHATRAGLVVQWRAAETNAASLALAARLGFEAVGRQFSFRLSE